MTKPTVQDTDTCPRELQGCANPLGSHSGLEGKGLLRAMAAPENTPAWCGAGWIFRPHPVPSPDVLCNKQAPPTHTDNNENLQLLINVIN